jgi:hypothetical protein
VAQRGVSREARNQLESSDWIAAAGLMIVAIAASLSMPFWPNRTQLLDMGKIIGYGWSSFLPWIFGTLIWIVCLEHLLRRSRKLSFGTLKPLVFPTTAVTYIAFFAMYPVSAIDVYIYSARSRLFSHYSENPNATQPLAHWDADPYMAYASKEWSDDLSPYGPLWNLIAYPVTWIGGDNIGIAIVGFKVLAVLSVLLIAWLVYLIVRESHPGWELTAVMFWLLNPLVLWDGIANAHNDVLLMVPVVAAIWASQKGLDRWVIPLLLVSVLIKYVTLILLPVAVVAVWRRNPEWRERISGVLLALASGQFLLAVSLFPFYDLGAIRESAEAQGSKVAVSPAWAIKSTLIEWDIVTLENEAIIRVAYAIVSLYIAGWMIVCWRNPERMPRATFEVLFAFMLIGSTNQRAWYVLWLIPIAALLIPANPWRRTAVWSVTSLLGHGCTIWLWYVWDIQSRGYYGYALIIVGVVFLPVIAITIWELARFAREQLQGGKRPASPSTRLGPHTSPR